MKPINKIIEDLDPSWAELANELYYPISYKEGGAEYEAFLRGVWAMQKSYKRYCSYEAIGFEEL